MNFTSRQLFLVLLAGLLLVGAASTGVGAQEDDGGTDEVRIVDEEIRIADGTFTISDTTITGPGIGNEYVDERKYVVEESTARFDGFHVTFRGTEYTFCRIQITVADVGVVLQDVQLKSL